MFWLELFVFLFDTCNILRFSCCSSWARFRSRCWQCVTHEYLQSNIFLWWGEREGDKSYGWTSGWAHADAGTKWQPFLQFCRRHFYMYFLKWKLLHFVLNLVLKQVNIGSDDEWQITSHHLKQCWLIIIEVLWHSPGCNFTRNAQDICCWYVFAQTMHLCQ